MLKNVGPELTVVHTQKTPDYITDLKYIYMLADSIIDYEAGESL